MANQYTNRNQDQDGRKSPQGQSGQQGKQQGQPGQHNQQGSKQHEQGQQGQHGQQGQPGTGGKQQGGSSDDRSRIPQGGKDDSLQTNQSSDKR